MTQPVPQSTTQRYDHWTISMHVYGSAFDRISGGLRDIDCSASEANLNRLGTKALMGAFPGATVNLIAYSERGLTTITVSDRPHDRDEGGHDAVLSAEIQARAYGILRNLFRSMNWLVASR